MPHIEELRPIVGPQPYILQYKQYREPELWHGLNPFTVLVPRRDRDDASA